MIEGKAAAGMLVRPSSRAGGAIGGQRQASGAVRNRRASGRASYADAKKKGASLAGRALML